MERHLHTCRVCQTQFISTMPRARFCSRECKRLYDKERYRKEKARRKAAPQSDNMKQYYAYCEKHGFVTYGKFQALKTVNALKERNENNET